VKAQAARFGRLFAVALASQAVALEGHSLTRSVIIAAVVGAAETAWRQFKPAPDAPAYQAQHEAKP
jgi:hypothetical protein